MRSLYMVDFHANRPLIDLNYKCNTTNTGLVNATAENIDGTMCTVYTLSNSTSFFSSPNGDYLGELDAGTKVGIASSICGNSRPYLLLVNKVKYPDMDYWFTFNRFIDLRFDLGNMPHNRLLR